MGILDDNPKPIVVDYDWDKKEEPILNKQCRFVWLRESENRWVRCVHQENNHPDRHEFELAWVVVGAEDDVQHAWAVDK